MSVAFKLILLTFVLILVLRFLFRVFLLFWWFIGWLSRHGLWFPKTTREIRKENLEKCMATNDQLDKYIEEMEKESSGVFRR